MSPGNSCQADLRHYSDSHPSDFYPSCLLPPAAAAAGTEGGMHSHLDRAKPGLINTALMEGAAVGLTYPSPLHQESRGTTEEKIPQHALPGGSSTCLGDPAHAHVVRAGREGMLWRGSCRDTQTGVKDREEKPCLLLCSCSNLNHTSKHSAPCTAYNTMLRDVETCRRREGSRTGIYSNEDLGEVMLQP